MHIPHSFKASVVSFSIYFGRNDEFLACNSFQRMVRDAQTNDTAEAVGISQLATGKTGKRPPIRIECSFVVSTTGSTS